MGPSTIPWRWAVTVLLLAAAHTRTSVQSFQITALPGRRRAPPFTASPFPLPRRPGSSALHMGLDVVTYLRTEWISAALCTNQTPRSADVCLQLGVVDARAVNFLPRTIQQLITSSMEPDGTVSLSIRRQLQQQADKRNAGKVVFADQRADALTETADESVDIVISLQAAATMVEKGLDWKKSIREAARVLKPGGRLLFVEQTEVEGESYLAYVERLYTFDNDATSDDQTPEDADERVPVFEVGSDDVDLVIVPHIAGVAVKAQEAGMSPKELAKKRSAEEDKKLADLALKAYERGSKRRRRQKKKKGNTAETTPSS